MHDRPARLHRVHLRLRAVPGVQPHQRRERVVVARPAVGADRWQRRAPGLRRCARRDDGSLLWSRRARSRAGHRRSWSARWQHHHAADAAMVLGDARRAGQHQRQRLFAVQAAAVRRRQLGQARAPRPLQLDAHRRRLLPGVEGLCKAHAAHHGRLCHHSGPGSSERRHAQGDGGELGAESERAGERGQLRESVGLARTARLPRQLPLLPLEDVDGLAELHRAGGGDDRCRDM
mmetsp:Transcript_66801/g.186657  ORF Transcript_66801/g.186657 Transcript_66801/m.186657 type:complete len:233 (-) Transcript_66801:1127-1825(-)